MERKSSTPPASWVGWTGRVPARAGSADGNDLYLPAPPRVVSPRGVVIKYNSKFPPPLSVAQAHDSGHRWRGTDFGGAYLEAITRVSQRRGYALVGCNVTGVNAFFVRADLLGEHFAAPCTAENHYQPARHYLWRSYISGHPPDWGEYVTI